MSLLTIIPEALLASVLSTWLTIVEVAHLDSAICSRSDRNEFLHTAYRCGTTRLSILDQLVDDWGKVCNEMNTWIFAKDALVSVLFVTPVVLHSHERRRAYLKRHGYAIRWVAYFPYNLSGEYYALYRQLTDEIAHLCPNLVRFEGASCQDESALLKLARGCPKLEEVNGLGDACTRDVVMELSRCCSKLRSIELTHEDLDEECLTALVRSSAWLLTLKTCGFGVTDKFVRELARSCTALSELEIKRADLTLSSLCFLLTDCGFMRNLRLEDCSFLPTAGDIVHDRYGCMRMLRLSNIDISEEELGDLLEACPDLTELEVSNCQELLHSDILPIGSSCRRLEKFSMMGNVLFASDEMFEELGENCPHLRVLEIAHFHFVTATGLAAVARGCPALECVDIRGCRQVGDDFLTALAQGCPELKVLLLFECVLITYQGLRVVMAGCPCLVELGVDSDGVLTEEEVLAIKACYPKTREDA